MLDEMHISNVALIREATFMPSAGLTVITGETGSGKTALLGALKLLVGDRADASMIRAGEEELRVEGRFYFPDSSEDGEVVARRVNRAGRSRVSLNGTLSSVKDIAQTVGASVDLCGQHEHQRLLKPAFQRECFDAWGADTINEPLAAYQAAFTAYLEAQKEVDRLELLEHEDTVALDRARFVVEQIEVVDPQIGEYEQLAEEMPRYEHGQLLLVESHAVREALSGSGSVLEGLEAAVASLEQIVRYDQTLKPQLEDLQSAYYSAEDAARQVVSYATSLDFSADEYETRQERFSALQGLMRGFGPRMEDVFETYHAACLKLSEFDNRGELLEAARSHLADTQSALETAAHELSLARAVTAPLFSAAIDEQLGRLEMVSAHLETVFEDLPFDQWTRQGSQSFQWYFSPGAGIDSQPLNRIASGGEISRVMLAIKVVAGAVDAVETLVFDEIDAGVGGKTARSLAAVLQDLGKTHQVIVVTHLPQVAVIGQAHYRVEKTNGDTLETCLEPLEGVAREEEIARMLAGEVTPTSLSHARELLAEVG